MADVDAERLLHELMAEWAGGAVPAAMDWSPPAGVRLRIRPRDAQSLGAELGERLVGEVLEGVRAGRQGIYISEPEKLRTAIFLRGYALGDFARRAGIAPATLSRALAGQPVAPGTWRLLITTLATA